MHTNKLFFSQIFNSLNTKTVLTLAQTPKYFEKKVLTTFFYESLHELRQRDVHPLRSTLRRELKAAREGEKAQIKFEWKTVCEKGTGRSE